jgi:hypothetical protein
MRFLEMESLVFVFAKFSSENWHLKGVKKNKP